MKKKIVLIIFFALSMPSILWAATYYVRPISGEYGAEDGSSYAAAFDGFADAWATIGNGANTLYVCGTHSEQLAPDANGTDDSNRLQIVSCTVANGASDEDPGIIDGVASATGAVYVTTDYVTVDGLTIVNADNSGLRINSGDYVTVKNCDITYSGGGIYIYNGSTGWIIEYNNISLNDTNGFLVDDGDPGPGIIRYNTFNSNGNVYHSTNCDPSDTGKLWYHAVYIGVGTTGETQIYSNQLTNTGCGHGLKIKASVDAWGNWIEGNANYNVLLVENGEKVSTQKLHHNVIIEPESTGTQWQNGIRFYQESAAEATLYIYNNVVYLPYDASEDGIGIASGEPAGTPQNVYIKNNIIYNAGTSGGNSYCISGYSAVGTTEIDGNLCYAAQANKYKLDGTSYTNLGDWQTAGYDTNGDYGDALFNDAGSDEFWLQNVSPAIDAGLDLGDSYDDALDPDSTWPSSVNTLDQDDYGAAWEIGAYVYEAAAEPTGAHITVGTSSITAGGTAYIQVAE